MPPTEGETYVMCNDCGARLYSTDDKGHGPYHGVKCPYKKDQMGICRTPEERPEMYK